jgi:NAD(P)-dependent dehydrogenase (short-subunit alcohol dehydrogenase family)
MKQSALVSGANRGIGLEITRQLSAQGWHVFAGSRKPDEATALQEIADETGRVTIVELDVSSNESVQSCVASLEVDALDLLINNAGIGGGGNFGSHDFDACRNVLDTNVLGPMRLAQSLLPLLHQSENPIVVNISSGAGSIASSDGGMMAYRISKAGLNMFTKTVAIDMPDLTVVSIGPGWVQTDMGGKNAAITPSESVSGILQVVSNLTQEDSGKFINYQGKEVPW